MITSETNKEKFRLLFFWDQGTNLKKKGGGGGIQVTFYEFRTVEVRALEMISRKRGRKIADNFGAWEASWPWTMSSSKKAPAIEAVISIVLRQYWTTKLFRRLAWNWRFGICCSRQELQFRSRGSSVQITRGFYELNSLLYHIYSFFFGQRKNEVCIHIMWFLSIGFSVHEYFDFSNPSLFIILFIVSEIFHKTNNNI